MTSKLKTALISFRQNDKLRFICSAAVSALILTLLIAAVTSAFIRGIDDILYSLCGEDALTSEAAAAEKDGGVSELRTFAVIFSALDHAEIRSVQIIPAALIFGFTLLVCLIVRRSRRLSDWRRRLCVLGAVFAGASCLLLSFAVNLYFAEVNGIGFGRVILSLYENLDALGGIG